MCWGERYVASAEHWAQLIVKLQKDLQKILLVLKFSLKLTGGVQCLYLSMR